MDNYFINPMFNPPHKRKNNLPVRDDNIIVRGDTFYGRPVRLAKDGNILYLKEDSRLTLGLFRNNQRFVKTITTAAQLSEGWISWGLTPAETETIEPGEYDYELEIYIDELTVFTVMKGIVRVMADLITPDMR